jgi:hypothetical protein
MLRKLLFELALLGEDAAEVPLGNAVPLDRGEDWIVDYAALPAIG